MFFGKVSLELSFVPFNIKVSVTSNKNGSPVERVIVCKQITLCARKERIGTIRRCDIGIFLAGFDGEEVR